MPDEEAVAAWCRFVRLALVLDSAQVAAVKGLVVVAKASRGQVAVSKRPLVRRLGTGPLLTVSN